MKEHHFSCFLCFCFYTPPQAVLRLITCVCVCQCKCFGSINGLYHFPDGFLQKEKHQNPPQVVFRYHSRVLRRRFYNNLMPSQSTSRCLNASFCVCVCVCAHLDCFREFVFAALAYKRALKSEKFGRFSH